MWNQNGMEGMKHTSFSGECTVPKEVFDYLFAEVERLYKEEEKAFRLFFLMKFGVPFKCAEGRKHCVMYGNVREYFYNGVSFATKDYSQEYYMRSTMSLDTQSEWLRNIPMKEFKIFGLTFKK